MIKEQLEQLNKADITIRQIAEELGLDLLPQEFDVVPAQKMLEIMAYHLPVNFSHWSFGRDYEIERTRHEYGFAVPYEVVFNSDPVRAYLMQTNPYPIQVLVMAHVYAHNDFMKVNRHFRYNRLDMMGYASDAAARFRQYEETYGRNDVERLLDAGLALQWNIDPEEVVHHESEEQARERLYGWEKKPPKQGPFDDLLKKRSKLQKEQKLELRQKTPPVPTVDLLGYIIDHSPRPLSDWERDLLQVIKTQAHYFLPYRRTKIMNEGWATFWHEKIMQQLFLKGLLDAEQHGFYNMYNARVKAHHSREINPYLLGYTLFCNIEDRWNKGRFGSEYEELQNVEERDSWDTSLGKGRDKIFDIRRTYMDWFFISEFLNKEVVEELNLYVYIERDRGNHYESQVEETDWRKVKDIMVHNMMNSGVPQIKVVDGNYRNSLQLYLKHDYEGLPLNEEYCRNTLEYVYYLWKRPVFLATEEPQQGGSRRKIYRCDDGGVHVNYE